MPIAIDNYLQNRKDFFNEEIKNFLPAPESEPSQIHEAMHYSIFAGGKRVRPILSLAMCESLLFEKSEQKVELYEPEIKANIFCGIAIECLHTYTLIHDDLPCMDDDDFRRGRLSSHKKFGENIAILAGDALNTIAFRALANIESENLAEILQILSDACGSQKLIGGQVLDILAEKGNFAKFDKKELLKKIHLSKTAELIKASLEIGVICAKLNDDKARQNVRDFGENLGLAFQIIDDILDETQSSETLGKSSGKDLQAEKLTYPAVYGLETAKNMAREHSESAIANLKNIPLKNTTLLNSITQKMLNRTF